MTTPQIQFKHEISTVFSHTTSEFKLYGLPVQVQTTIEPYDLLAQYQYDAYPLPQEFIPYLDEIVILPQHEIEEEFSANTSGYTRTYFIDDVYNGSTIYLSDTLFRKTTLLHEALHVIDARFQFSNSKQFEVICSEEMDHEYNARIINYYDEAYYCSEYFVESYINYLYDNERFKQLQPHTYDFIQEAERQIGS